MQSQDTISMQHASSAMARLLQEFNPYQPTVSQLLDFLHLFYEVGLTYSVTEPH